jgi:hypothetical protein
VLVTTAISTHQFECLEAVALYLLLAGVASVILLALFLRVRTQLSWPQLALVMMGLRPLIRTRAINLAHFAAILTPLVILLLMLREMKCLVRGQ